MGVILGILFAVLAVVGVLLVLLGKRKKNKKYILSGSILSAVMVIMFVFLPFSFHQVDSGEIAVVKVWGKAKEIKTEGLSFNNWISTKYVKYDITTQEIKCEISAYSQDAQSMNATLAVQFRILPDKAIEINKQFGSLDTLTERLRAVSEEKTKVVLSESSAMVLIETRSGLSSKVEEKIKESIDQYYVTITMVAVTDINFSEAFENTVEDKMIAEQEKLKAEYEKEKAIIQAKQALEVAKLEAEAKLAEAEGEANAIEAIAKAEANSIKLKSVEVARTLGFDIIETEIKDADNNVIGTNYDIDFSGKTETEIAAIAEYLKYIEYLEKWDGKLPEVVTGENANIFIPVKPSNPASKG